MELNNSKKVPIDFDKLFASGCILNFGSTSSSYNQSGCEGANWGGFLNKTCSGEAFQDYLYALGMRANRTGQIYLSLMDQRNCFIRISSSDVDILDCGTEKLTMNRGGCSNFSVTDVTDRLGSSIRNLKDKCSFANEDEGWDQSCGFCQKGWKEIQGMHPKVVEFTEVDSDVCRFCVLITLISARIKDEAWVGKLFNCLANQNSDEGNEAEENAEENKAKSESGICILIGGIIGFLLVTLLSIWIFLKRKNSSDALVKKTASGLELQKESDCLKFPIKVVYSATKNLHPLNVIGEGTAGKVYKGLLSNNQHVAIKHITNDGETFLREVRSLSHVRHPNLATLQGYCEKEGECFLIYEFCPNGNLSEWLFGTDKVLSWIQRLQIAVDSARGLCFLHTYPQGCIVHRDIKPTNILLGKNFEAKLSDFGLSKVIDLGETNASSEVRGTFGYVDPEYQINRRVNSAGDVYSFGIVLLQMLSGRKVIDIDMRKPQPLEKFAKSLTREGRRCSLELADPRLNGEYSAEAFELTFELALSCTAPKQQRPSMEQVVASLEEALHLSTKAKASSPVTSAADSDWSSSMP
ncbi:hypothetical protein ACH5RR_011089 [Cinchona calisaya]|uniref:Protein kinase domain-containing protein n=1 Tax=Cinchona calisaya TaxID=153742 RepID=A0ABD3A5E1_9GENT